LRNSSGKTVGNRFLLSSSGTRKSNFFHSSAKTLIKKVYKQEDNHQINAARDRELSATEVELAAMLETETVGFGQLPQEHSLVTC